MCSAAHPDLSKFYLGNLAQSDREVADILHQELARQQDGIELIASENIVSLSVLESQGSVLTNKYAEGLPGKRYYGGCVEVDKVETLAIDRLTRISVQNLPMCSHIPVLMPI